MIPESIYKKAGKPLLKANTMLTGPGQHLQLEVIGVVKAKIAVSRTRSTFQKVFAVKNIKIPLLGRPAIQALSLLTKVVEVDLAQTSVFREFPDLFQGLGKLTGEYHIKLKESATP